MSSITAKGLDGKALVLSAEILGGLRTKLRGTLCLPGEPGYEQARTIWNAMIDRQPAVIVRAAGAADVMPRSSFARRARPAARGHAAAATTSPATPCATAG